MTVPLVTTCFAPFVSYQIWFILPVEEFCCQMVSGEN